MKTQRIIIPLLCVAVLGASASTASAWDVAPVKLADMTAEADAVLVGTVLKTRHSSRNPHEEEVKYGIATVRVQEWLLKTGDRPKTVSVLYVRKSSVNWVEAQKLAKGQRILLFGRDKTRADKSGASGRFRKEKAKGYTLVVRYARGHVLGYLVTIDPTGTLQGLWDRDDPKTLQKARSLILLHRPAPLNGGIQAVLSRVNVRAKTKPLARVTLVNRANHSVHIPQKANRFTFSAEVFDAAGKRVSGGKLMTPPDDPKGPRDDDGPVGPGSDEGPSGPSPGGPSAALQPLQDWGVDLPLYLDGRKSLMKGQRYCLVVTVKVKPPEAGGRWGGSKLAMRAFNGSVTTNRACFIAR